MATGDRLLANGILVHVLHAINHDDFFHFICEASQTTTVKETLENYFEDNGSVTNKMNITEEMTKMYDDHRQSGVWYLVQNTGMCDYTVRCRVICLPGGSRHMFEYWATCKDKKYLIGTWLYPATREDIRTRLFDWWCEFSDMKLIED